MSGQTWSKKVKRIIVWNEEYMNVSAVFLSYSTLEKKSVNSVSNQYLANQELILPLTASIKIML